MMSKQSDRDTEADLQNFAATCAAGRGVDIVALDVRELVEYMDFLLIVTGSSARRNRAMAENVVKQVKAEGYLPMSRSGVENGQWICLDLIDVVVHIFDAETRAHYDLELLWADAPKVELDLATVAVTAPADDAQPVDAGVIMPPSDTD